MLVGVVLVFCMACSNTNNNNIAKFQLNNNSRVLKIFCVVTLSIFIFVGVLFEIWKDYLNTNNYNNSIQTFNNTVPMARSVTSDRPSEY